VAADSAERALISARAGADQAHQVVDIVNISFRLADRPTSRSSTRNGGVAIRIPLSRSRKTP